MSRRIRPSARRKTLGNVKYSNLSETDKKCIEEVFEKFNERVAVVKCKDCEYLMFSDCNGECSRGYMGIVSPDDFCSRAVKKDGA